MMAQPLTESSGTHDEASSDDDLPGQETGLKELDKSQVLRRTQLQKLDDWLLSEDNCQSIVNSVIGESSHLDRLSLSEWAFEQRERIVQNPRQYQLDLFERAKLQNTIAVLDTGSGKTLIAILLLWHVINEELAAGVAESDSGISFFLVPTVILAYQQHVVLEHNIDHPIIRICGEDRPEEWDKEKWQDIVHTNKVMVCTADVLLHCLDHGYVHMPQIRLLIFDEAHHTKKNHAYARIIKDFYLALQHSEQPRIFGMTASPVDGKDDVVLAAKQLEILLDSKIATIPTFSFDGVVGAPAEHILNFEPSPLIANPTPFFRHMEKQTRGYDIFEQDFNSTMSILPELGEWCADEYLASCLTGRAMDGHRYRAERMCYVNNIYSVPELNLRTDYLRRVEDEAHQTRKGPNSMCSEAMTPKVATLLQYLGTSFGQRSEQRCIIFVQKRHTARLLAKLLGNMANEDIKADSLLGFSAHGEANEASFRCQKATLVKFRRGDVNCLVATSVAEEGLDIPACNLVIRFDLYTTMIQYVQSRGRARKRDSVFVHMMETGNVEHIKIYSQVKTNEESMRKFCQSLPQDRILDADADMLEIIMAKEKGCRSYTEASSGAKLTYGNAPLCLARFIASIPQENQQSIALTYDMTRQGERFVATVLLPGNAPFHSVTGRSQRNHKLAQRSAAFEACLELRKRAFLDEHFNTTYARKLPQMANALLSVGMAQQARYDRLTKPEIWSVDRGSIPSTLFAVIIDFPDGVESPYQAIMLLTRSRLPEFPSFSVFLNSGVPSTVRSTNIGYTLPVDNEILHKLTNFTCCIFNDLFSKKFEADPGAFSYWLAPVSRDISAKDLRCSHDCTPVNDYIDWMLLDRAATTATQRWTPDLDPNTLLDRLITDPWHGGRKFYATAIAQHLKPSDQVPSSATLIKQSHGNSTILGNTVSGSKKGMALHPWNMEQPVLQAEIVSLRRNMLSAPEKATPTEMCYICPEPLTFSPIPKMVTVAFLFWPGIINRLESYLIADAACKLLGLECTLDLALAAITKDSDNSGDHTTDIKINFQDGMGENYERLEFLGDTFLKVATTLSTFVRYPDNNEFESHVTRMVMLCNKNLFNSATSSWQLHKYIRSKTFSRRTWYPEGLKLLKGKSISTNDEQHASHALSQKTIADVCEALIGAAFLTHHVSGKWQPAHWTQAVRAVTALVQNENHQMLSWTDYGLAYSQPSYLDVEPSAAEIDLACQVEGRHSYQFRQPRLLRSAFTHPSYVQGSKHIPNYERLEFLGDSLLDMAAVTHIFYLNPQADPQWLTEHKMAIVSNKFLGALCVDLGFHKHLRYFAANILRAIADYAEELTAAKVGKERRPDYWTQVSDPPKCLADIVEAYIGAMFVDSDFDYGEVQRFFDEHIAWYFDDMKIYDSFASPQSRASLLEFFDRRYGCQAVDLMVRDMPNLVQSEKKQAVLAVVAVHEEILVHNLGRSVISSKIGAVKKAIDECKGLDEASFQARFRCDCRLQKDASPTKKEDDDVDML